MALVSRRQLPRFRRAGRVAGVGVHVDEVVRDPLLPEELLGPLAVRAPGRAVDDDPHRCAPRDVGGAAAGHLSHIGGGRPGRRYTRLPTASVARHNVTPLERSAVGVGAS